MKAIHMKDAIRLLETGQPCTIHLWKMSTGDILTYRDARCISAHWRGGTHKVKLPLSNVVRCLRDIAMFEINGMSIYL